jgi:hypothetical protein
VKDELIKATRPERYYWFIFMLLLKMVRLPLLSCDVFPLCYAKERA